MNIHVCTYVLIQFAHQHFLFRQTPHGMPIHVIPINNVFYLHAEQSLVHNMKTLWGVTAYQKIITVLELCYEVLFCLLSENHCATFGALSRSHIVDIPSCVRLIRLHTVKQFRDHNIQWVSCLAFGL